MAKIVQSTAFWGLFLVPMCSSFVSINHGDKPRPLQALKATPDVDPPNVPTLDALVKGLPDSAQSALSWLCRPGSRGSTMLGLEGGVPAVLADLEYSDDDKNMLSQTLDFLQTSLLSFGNEDVDPEEDLDFIAEGRKIMAINRCEFLGVIFMREN
jgi:hypothetical protein